MVLGHTVKRPVDILTKEEVERIQQGVLDVLEKTGVTFQHEEALKILKDVGCDVDLEKQRARFPNDLVEESLKKCPSSFELMARNPEWTLKIGDPTVYFSTFSGKNHLDLDTMEIRPPTAQEWREAVRVIDFLDEVHWAGYAYGDLWEEGVRAVYIFPYLSALLIRNTGKTTWLGGLYGAEKWAIRMYKAAGTMALGSVAASPPLCWYQQQINVLLSYAEAGIPIKPTSGLAAGGNAPASLAGALIQNCAEIISAIVLVQSIKPGIGVICQDYSQSLDMRTGSVVQGGIERGLMGAAWCQIWRSYRIPRMTMISSDAKIPDYQCAMEKVMSLTLHALAGSNMMNFMGVVYDELAFSPVVTIIDNDVARMVGRMLDGINVTDRTLAVDLIEEVGPLPGQFLDKEHTRVIWKEEQLVPDLVDRLPYPQWVKQGKKDIIKRARERFKEILATHEPPPLTKEQNEEIDKILEEAKKFYKEKGLA